MSIYYFNALAGAGKTYALARYADRCARRDQKVLFVQPSKRLIDQTIAQEITPLNPIYPVTPIHGDVCTSVVNALVEHFKTTMPGGEIVFATHAALLRLPYAEGAQNWLLIVDEVPQVDVFEELNLSETHRLLTDHLVMAPTSAAYGQLLSRRARS